MSRLMVLCMIATGQAAAYFSGVGLKTVLAITVGAAVALFIHWTCRDKA